MPSNRQYYIRTVSLTEFLDYIYVFYETKFAKILYWKYKILMIAVWSLYIKSNGYSLQCHSMSLCCFVRESTIDISKSHFQFAVKHLEGVGRIDRIWQPRTQGIYSTKVIIKYFMKEKYLTTWDFLLDIHYLIYITSHKMHIMIWVLCWASCGLVWFFMLLWRYWNICVQIDI